MAILKVLADFGLGSKKVLDSKKVIGSIKVISSTKVIGSIKVLSSLEVTRYGPNRVAADMEGNGRG